ncbi:MAG: MmgE/PrpD family protein, partial [Chloroflexota bacterium]|nr:MmgE/PrpD family protein [Chloroflexota bacterium]
MWKSATELANWALDLRLEDVPADVATAARLQILDTVGVCIAGQAVAEVRDFSAALVRGQPTATIWGTQWKAPLLSSALAMAASGTWHDFDSGNRFAGGHATIHTLPAVVAYAEANNMNGRAVLEAFAAGYEIANRLGRATKLREGLHPHGTWPVVGAAVALSKLAGLSAEDTARCARIASGLTLVTSFQTAYEGATVRNVYAGIGAHHALLALRLTQAGFTGLKRGLEVTFGQISGTSFSASLAGAEFG